MIKSAALCGGQPCRKCQLTTAHSTTPLFHDARDDVNELVCLELQRYVLHPHALHSSWNVLVRGQVVEDRCKTLAEGFEVKIWSLLLFRCLWHCQSRHLHLLHLPLRGPRCGCLGFGEVLRHGGFWFLSCDLL